MIKAIVFDCFGVLAEDGWMPIKRKYVGDNEKLAQAVADLGKQNEYGMIDNDVHLTKMAELIGIGREVLGKSLGVRVPNEDLFEYIVKELKPKYKLGLLSNANYNVMKELFTPEQASIFDASVMSYESRLIKPDERMFELMAERLGVATHEFIFIDDQERYCAAANMLNIPSIWYRSLEQCIAELDEMLSR